MERKLTIMSVADKCASRDWKAYTGKDGKIYLQEGALTTCLSFGDPGDRERFGENEQRDNGPYKGFLMIKCEQCGEVKGFCARQETYSFKCNECGYETPLEGLKPMYMKCKCGEEFRYKTNLTDKVFSRNCLSCGSPVDMQLNKRETAYVTIGESGKR